MKLKTKYEIGEIPHSEHPCPQRMRQNWLCLNGEWDLQKLDKDGKNIYSCKSSYRGQKRRKTKYSYY